MSSSSDCVITPILLSEDLTQVLIKPNETPMEQLLLSLFLQRQDLEAERNKVFDNTAPRVGVHGREYPV